MTHGEIFYCIKCKQMGSAQDTKGWERLDSGIDRENSPTEDTKWLCPTCIADFWEVKELQKQNEEIAPLVEGWSKVMDIMAKLGHLIDKAKNDSLGGK